MSPSRDAFDLLHPRRAYWHRQWERAWPIVAVFLTFICYAIVGHYDREEYLVERAVFIADKQNMEWARNLPEHIFVISASSPKEARGKLSDLEIAAAIQRNELVGAK